MKFVAFCKPNCRWFYRVYSLVMGAMAPGSEVTFFLAGTSVSTLSIAIQSKKFSISMIALFYEYHNSIKEIFNFCDCFV